MLYYELEDNYIFIPQNTHGNLSGHLAQNFKKDCFLDNNRREDLLFAISHHDRAWIDMDHTLLWNDGENKPYSFMDYPLILKLTFYRKALDEIEEMNPYAGLLCSLHFQSLMKRAKDERSKTFIAIEASRVARLKNTLNIDAIEEQQLKYHLSILQFFDGLSLYTCLQEGKTASEKDFTWFKDGFPQRFKCLGNEKVKAKWIGNRTIVLDPFPFDSEIEAPLTYKKVRLNSIKNKGIATAYNEAPLEKKLIKFMRK